MTDEPDPLWHHLPHKPLVFFGLHGEFDRKQLKRKYNALIRRFKPETHPAEFQQIRAAFETLDTRLRYGESVAERAPSATYQWSAPASLGGQSQDASVDESPSGSKAQDRSPAKPAGPAATVQAPLARRLRERPPREFYAELNRKDSKSPFDYYALAALADIVGNDPLLFPHWLLAGLRAHSHDPALLRLLEAYFRSGVPVESIARLLTATAKVVNTDRFYQLCEPLWDELLRRVDFAAFRSTLDSCERQLVDHRIHSKLVFYLHLLRPCLWKADPDWIANVAGLLEENRELIPAALERDLELTLLLVEYRASSKKFATGHPIRTRIDEAMHAYCTRDEAEADRAVIECQVQLAADGAGVLEAFPLRDDSFESMHLPWLLLNADVGSRCELKSPPTAEELAPNRAPADLVPDSWTSLALMTAGSPASAIATQVLRMLDDINRHTPWNLYRLGTLGIRVTCYVAAALLVLLGIFPILIIPGGVAALLLIPAAVAAYHFTLRERTVDPLIRRFTSRFLRHEYERHWRRHLQRMLVATHLPVNELANLLKRLQERDADRTAMAGLLLPFLCRDPGLTIFSLAQRLLR